LVLLVCAILGPVWLPFTGPEASAGDPVIQDLGQLGLYGGCPVFVSVGDCDRDNISEAYFLSYYGGNIFQVCKNGSNWSSVDLGPVLDEKYSYGSALGVGDADDDGRCEVYAIGVSQDRHNFALCRFSKEKAGWVRSVLCNVPYNGVDIKCGDCDGDGCQELYVVEENHHIYMFSVYNKWNPVEIGAAKEYYDSGSWITPRMNSISIGDGDNDGQNEVYGAAEDNHLYRFNLSDGAWSRTDLWRPEPKTGSDEGMISVAIIDVDRDGQNEVLGASNINASVWRYYRDMQTGWWYTANVWSGAGQLDSTSMAIGDADSDGRYEIFLGIRDSFLRQNQLYELADDVEKDTWKAGVIGSLPGSIYSLAVGRGSTNSEEWALFIGAQDGHGYVFYDDHIPPRNPAVTSGTHPEPGKWYKNTNVHVCWTGTGSDISGIAGYSYIWDDCPDTIPDEKADSPATVSSVQKTLLDGDGWYFHIRTVDGSGNWNRSAAHFGPVRIDRTPPDVANVVINATDGWTNSSVVSLFVMASDPAPGSGVARMAFSHDGFSWCPWEPFAPVRAEWDLANTEYGGTGADGLMSVQVKVMDLVGNEIFAINCGSDEILVDRKGPVDLAIVINDGADFTNTTEVRLHLSGMDPEPSSGQMEMAFSNDGINWSEWEAWGPAKKWSLADGAGGSRMDGKRAVWFRSRDGAGNAGGPVSDSIVFDSAVPIVTMFNINDGAQYTNSNHVTLSIDVADPGPSSGVDRMALSRDGINWEEWEAFTWSYWELGPDEGVQTVFVTAMDGAGNVGPAANASIILDTTAPTVSIQPLPAVVPLLDFTVSWNGSDTFSGIRFYDIQYRAQGGDSSWNDWLMNTWVTSGVFLGTDGNSYCFRARAKDYAGNLGSFNDIGGGWVRVDVPRPVATINRPAEKSVVKGLCEMNGGSFHPDANLTVISVEIRVDDGPWSIVIGTSNWSWVLDSRLLLDGKHHAHVRAYDGSKYSPEVSREFTVKNAKENTDADGTPWSTFLRMMIVVVVFCAVAVLWLQARRKEQKSR